MSRHLSAMAPSAATVAKYTERGDWSDRSLADILASNAKQYADRDAVVDGRRRLTYTQFYLQAERLAARWVGLGLGREDVIAIQLPNCAEFAIAVAAATLAGIPFCQFHSDFRRKEVEFILRFSEATLLVTPSSFRGFDHLALIESLQPELAGLKYVDVVGDEVPEGWFNLRRFLDEETAPVLPPETLHQYKPNGNDVMRMLFTSGTTGDPKAVVNSHNNTLSSCRFHVRDWRVTKDSAFLVFLPVGLNMGFGNTVQAQMAGCKIVFLDKFNPEEALRLIEKERITHFGTAPAGLVALLNAPNFAKYDLSSLEVVITGGAACPIDLIRRWRKSAPGHLLELYGMAECGGQASTKLVDDPETVSGTVGRPTPEMGLRIVTENGESIAPGEIGEIQSTGPSLMLGYYNNPEANARAFTEDGWFRTGDLGYLGADGYLRIAGRIKEMIIRGGANIYPREIEEVLYRHKAVLDAAVVGIPDEKLGERACACLVLKSGETITPAEVVDFLRGEIATYKLPERVVFLDALPRNATGKIQRGPLRDLAVAAL